MFKELAFVRVDFEGGGSGGGANRGLKSDRGLYRDIDSYPIRYRWLAYRYRLSLATLHSPTKLKTPNVEHPPEISPPFSKDHTAANFYYTAVKFEKDINKSLPTTIAGSLSIRMHRT